MRTYSIKSQKTKYVKFSPFLSNLWSEDLARTIKLKKKNKRIKLGKKKIKLFPFVYYMIVYLKRIRTPKESF